MLDADGIAGEVIFVDGITEMNTPPFGAGLSLPTEDIVPELQWAGARAHNRWLAELCAQAPARHCGVAVMPLLWMSRKRCVRCAGSTPRACARS